MSRKLRYWGIALILIGYITSSFAPAIVQWTSQTNRDPLAPDIAYYVVSFIAQVGVPLGAALFAVSFIAVKAKRATDETE